MKTTNIECSTKIGQGKLHQFYPIFPTENRLIDSINKFLLNNSLKNAQIDYSKVLFPITIRNYRKGETFVPLGMNKNKKISDFLSDNKIAKIDRMKQCVIKDSNKNIVWVVGHQIHNSYRVTRKTSTVMDLQII